MKTDILRMVSSNAFGCLVIVIIRLAQKDSGEYSVPAPRTRLDGWLFWETKVDKNLTL